MNDSELEKIYNEGYRAVYWTAMAILKSEQDAEDIVHDTFVTLIKSYDSIKDKNKVLSWLKKNAANKCLDKIKLTKTDNVDDEFFDQVEAVSEDFLPDSIIESEEMRKVVMDIIENSLSEEIRRTLILFYFDEMSTKEIAEALNIPQGTVSWRISFAKKTIKKEVEKYEEKNDTKLFAMAIPFLTKLFMKEAEQVPFRPMPASLTTLSASAKASAAKAGTKVASTAIKKGTGFMFKKWILAIIAAITLTTVATTGIVIYKMQTSGKNTESKKHSSEISEDKEEKSKSEESEDTDVKESDNSASSEEPGVEELNALLDPGATVITQLPVINGHEIKLPCTIGDIKNMGFTIDEDTIFDGNVSAVYDEGLSYYAFFCYLDVPASREGTSVNDDDTVIAIEVFMEGTDMDFYGVQIGMHEEDFLPLIGTPSYITGLALDYGQYYYYMGADGTMYELYFMNFSNPGEDESLSSVVFGTQEFMIENRRIGEDL